MVNELIKRPIYDENHFAGFEEKDKLGLACCRINYYVRPFNVHKTKHLITGMMLLLFLITVFIIAVRIMKSRDNDERQLQEWYSKQLRYEFGAKADTVVHLKQKWGYGEIYFTPDESQVDLTIEDSIQSATDSELRFITRGNDGRYKFAIQNAQKYLAGDSVYVKSSENRISVFRAGKLLSTHKINRSLRDRRF